jgi:hypothetical protein
MFVQGMMPELMQAKMRDVMMEAAQLEIEREARALRAENPSEHGSPSRRTGRLHLPAFVVQAFRGAPAS